MAAIGKQRRSEERSDLSLAQGDRIARSKVRQSFRVSRLPCSGSSERF